MRATAISISPIPVSRRNMNLKHVHRNVRAQSFDIVKDSDILGQGITAGVIFYASLQWAYYRRLRIEAEKIANKKEKKKDDK